MPISESECRGEVRTLRRESALADGGVKVVGDRYCLKRQNLISYLPNSLFSLLEISV